MRRVVWLGSLLRVGLLLAVLSSWVPHVSGQRGAQLGAVLLEWEVREAQKMPVKTLQHMEFNKPPPSFSPL